MSHVRSALETGQAKLWILLVGVNEYYDRRFPALQYSEADCQGLATALTDATQAFPQRSIQVLHDTATLAPTLNSIRSSLQTIADQAQPQDTVLFYFCGHSALETRFQQAVLCLADTERETLIKTGLSLMSLLGILGSCAAKQQILWLDTCHGNGKQVQSEFNPAIDEPSWQLIDILQQSVAQNSALSALLACDRAQQSWKFPELGHGVFTHFLIEGLRGKAANAAGTIEMDALSHYVQQQTRRYLEQTNQHLQWLHEFDGDPTLSHSKAFVQTPKRIGRGNNSLIVGVKPLDPLELVASVAAKPARKQPPAGIPAFQPSEAMPQSRKVEPTEPKTPTVEEVAPSLPEPIPSVPAPPIVEELPIQPVFESAQLEEPPIDLPTTHTTSDFAEIEPISPAPLEMIEPIPTIEPISPAKTESIESIPATPELPPTPIIEPILPAQPDQTETIITPTHEPTITPVIHQRAIPKVEAPIRSRRRKQPAQSRRDSRKIQEATQKRIRQISSAIGGVKQSAHQWAIAGQDIYRQGNTQLRQITTATVHHLGASVRQFANTGQTLYRASNTQLRQSVTSTSTTLNQSAAHLKESVTSTSTTLNQSVRRLAQSVTHQAHHPQTLKLVGVTIGGLGIAACGVAGVTLYQQRNAQLGSLQTLVTSSKTLLSTHQNSEALVAALKAGQTLQTLDRPWNFVSEAEKLDAIATLQQAIMKSSGQFSATLEDKFSNASLSPDQKTFAVTTTDQSIQLWQREENQLQRLNITFKGHQGTINQIRFSPDGKFLASASDDKTIKIWNTEKGILVRTLTGHKDRVTALEFRSDGGVLASGSADQTVKLWGVENGNLLDTLEGNNSIINVIRFSPDGRILATGSADDDIRVWYPDSNKPILLGRHGSTIADKKGITDLAFSADGKAIASAGQDKAIYLWTVDDAKSNQTATPRASLTGHTAIVTRLSFSPSGNLLASGSQDQAINLWDTQANKLITRLSGHQDPITSLAFHADGKRLLSASDRNGLIQWNLDLPTLRQQGCNLFQASSPTPEIDSLCPE